MAGQESRKEPDMEVRMSFGEHIEELRKRLVRSLVCLLVVIVGLMFFYGEMAEFIVKPHFQAMAMLGKDPSEVQFLPKGYQTPILSFMKMAFILGLFICSPIIGWQLWGFVAAGLYRKEKKYVVRFAPVSFCLFLGGCCFGYFLLIPYALYGLAGMMELTIILPEVSASEEKKGEDPDSKPPDDAGKPPAPDDGKGTQKTAPAPKEPDPDAPKKGPDVPAPKGTDPPAQDPTKLPPDQNKEKKEQEHPLFEFKYNFDTYLNLVLLLTIILGAIFQLPLIMVFLVKIGLCEPKTFHKWRRASIIFNVCFAAIVTPADIFTMMIVAAPMVILYEIGVVVSYLVARKPKPAGASPA